MFRKLVSMLVVAGFLFAGANAFTMTKTDLVGKSAPSITQGKVTYIQGNVITVTDIRGQKKVLELNSVEGLKVGDAVAIEEDPWHARIKIGEKTIGVQKVVQ